MLIAQWEVTVALASQRGVDPQNVDTSIRHPSFRARYGSHRVTVYIVGNPLQEVGAYISTDGVAAQMADIIGSSGRSVLTLFAHPEHLPRVYRSSIGNFNGQGFAATIFPAMIPFSLNYPVLSNGAVINLYEGSAFLRGPNYGMWPDSAQVCEPIVLTALSLEPL